MARHGLITLLEGTNSEELALQELRSMTRDGVDIELIVDIMTRAHRVLRQLGLDPSDVTAQEVYQALITAVQTEQWLQLLGDTEFVLFEVDGQVISFNPIDIVENYHHRLPLEKQRTTAAKKGLGWEITARYKKHPQTMNQRVEAAAKRAKWPTEEPQFCRIVFDKPSILVVGDIATEALITLGSKGVRITDRKIALDVGARIACDNTLVMDAVGGAANASVAFSRLGVQPSLVAWLGDDTAGRQAKGYLRANGVDMSGVSVKEHGRSSYHYVIRHQAERTVLANYENFDYVWRQPACKPDWVYLSMISGQSWEMHRGLMEYLARNKDIKLAFQPGPAHFEWGAEQLRDVYQRSEVVVMNKEEAAIVVDKRGREPGELLKEILKLGVKVAVITDGPQGAYATDGELMYTIPQYPDIDQPADRTGAGDAFAATLVASLASGKTLEQALTMAPVNAMSVVHQLGSQAGLLRSEEIEQLLANPPEGYEVAKRDL